MSIETICQTCARKLRVADEYAGKKARCPQCGTIYVVPGRPEVVSSWVEEAGYKGHPETETWQVRTPDGQVYGPVPKSELDRWVQEGRIPAEAMLHVGSAEAWCPAFEVYPQLHDGATLSAASNPFAEPPVANPYQAPVSASSSSARRPHRGMLILVFGILGCVVCFFFAPLAWLMGNADLRDMRRGQMDDSGMALTQAGMILGMIATILGLLLFALFCAGALL